MNYQVTVLYANKGSKFLFNGDTLPLSHETIRNYTLVLQKNTPAKSTPEEWFSWLNQEDLIGQDVAEKVGHTSMSVGDIIIINSHRYMCQSAGWKEF